MPARYEAIKASLKKQHPDWSEDTLKEHASRIFVGTAGGKKKRSAAAKSLHHG